MREYNTCVTCRHHRVEDTSFGEWITCGHPDEVCINYPTGYVSGQNPYKVRHDNPTCPKWEQLPPKPPSVFKRIKEALFGGWVWRRDI